MKRQGMKLGTNLDLLLGLRMGANIPPLSPTSSDIINHTDPLYFVLEILALSCSNIQFSFVSAVLHTLF